MDGGEAGCSGENALSDESLEREELADCSASSELSSLESSSSSVCLGFMSTSFDLDILVPGLLVLCV